MTIQEINVPFEGYYCSNYDAILDSMVEYNFTTDKLFCNISESDIKRLFDNVKCHSNTFNEVIKKRFTSYDGFISSYSNDFQEWLKKDCLSYDHNELGTLLISAITCKHDFNSFNNEVLENVIKRVHYNGELDIIFNNN